MQRHQIVVLGSILRIVSLAATTCVALFLMPFLVRSLGDRMYGYWALAGAVLSYYGVMDLGIVSAVEFQVARSLGEEATDSVNEAISTSFYAFAGIGAVILSATILLASLVHLVVHDPADANLFRKVLIIMGMGCAAGFPGRAFIGAVSAYLRWDLIASINLFLLGLRTTAIVFSIKAGGGIVGLALIALSAEVLSYGLLYLTLRWIHPALRISRSLASKAKLKEILGYGGSAFIVKVADQLRFYTDGWMVSFVVSIAAVTHYAIASRLSLSMLDLVIAVVGILSPWFSFLLGSRDFDGIRRVLTFGTKISTTLSTIITICLIIYGRAFVQAWMGPRYVDAYWPLVLLLLAIFLNVSQMPSISYLYGVSRHKFLAQITAVEAVANFGLSLYWGLRWGMIGVALGTLVPMFIMKVMFQPAYTCKHSGIPLRTYFVGIMGRTMGACTLGVIIPWAVLFRYRTPESLLGICVVLVVQGSIAMVAAFFFAFTKQEKALIVEKMFTFKRSRPQPAIVESVDVGS